MADGTSADVTLELLVPPAQAERLFRTPALAALRAGRIRARPARITWRDTPDGALAEAGLVLSEIEIGGPVVVLEQACRDGTALWPPGVPAPGANRIETALSSVAIAVFHGTARTLPVADPALRDVVLLQGELQVGDTVRAEARVTLRGRTAPAAPVLQPDLSLDEAFARVVGALAAVLLHHAPDAAAGRAPEPVHQMRVALRRLRSALSLFRKVADNGELDRARQALRALAGALGPARDWDVFLAGAGREAAKLVPDEPAVIRLLAAAKRKRRAAYAGLGVLLTDVAFQRTILDLTRLAVARPWVSPETQAPALVAFARHALDRRLRRVLAAGEDLAPLPPAELHALRIQCKRLRYAAEFFAPLSSGRRVRRFLRRLASVQERLGQLNDGTVAADLMQDLGRKGFAAGVVAGAIAARTAGSRGKAERSFRKFLRTEPFWH